MAGGLAGLAGLALTQVGSITRASAAVDPGLAGFPDGIELTRGVFRNWDGTIVTDQLWTATVRGPDEVQSVTQWAADAGYRLRPRGYGHSWSPLVTDTATNDAARVVIVDTTALTAMSMVGAERVRVQAGAKMSDLLAFLSEHGRSVIGAPAPGDITVGGALAVNGHGTNLPRRGDVPPSGATYGSLSNTIVELTAVVWDDAAGSYVLRTYQRTDSDIAALLVSLGRTLVTEVVLQTVPNYTIRCRNYTHLHRTTLFAAPGSAGDQSLASLVDTHGRVGLIWFAMTGFPWVQLWDVEPRRPLLSRPVYSPYNYPFADRLPDAVAQLIGQVTAGAGALTPVATNAQLTAVVAGLTATGARDMWGEARHFIHFVRPTTLRVSAGSHVVLARRADLQDVVHQFTEHYLGLIEQFRQRGLYPANNTCEIRITGLDHPEDSGIDGAQTASLSAIAPVAGRPELDTAIWLDVLTLPGTPGADELFAGLEQWFSDLPPELGVARPEWAKRFATTVGGGSWTDTEDLRQRIPSALPAFTEAVATLERLDPRGVFRAQLHDRLMPE